MRHAIRLSIWLKIILLLLVLGGGTAVLTSHATPNGGYQINWWTTDSGGGTSNGATYILSGSIGQHDAGALSSASYELNSGFWGDMDNNTQAVSVFLPVIIR